MATQCFSLLDAVLEPVVVTKMTESLEIVFANAAVTQLGYDAKELVGTSATALIPPELISSENHAAKVRSFVETGSSSVVGVHGRSLEAVAADGTRVPVLVGLEKFSLAGEDVFVISMLDVSDHQKRVTEEVRANTERSILETVVHELRNPLLGISSAATLLKTALETGNGTLDRAQVHADVESIIACARIVQRLVGNVLDLHKLESGEQIPFVAQGPVSVRGVIEDAILALRHIGKTGVTLRAEVDASVPAAVLSDATRLMQIVMNLVTNSLKHTDAGEVVVLASHAGGKLFVEVRDTGCGVPPEEHESIFEKYKQAAADRNVEASTGLGVHLTKLLVTTLGGQISLESDPTDPNVWPRPPVEHGSSFKVEIPAPPHVLDEAPNRGGAHCAKMPRLAEDIVAPPLGAALSEHDEDADWLLPTDLRVLLVDDVELNRKLIRRVLTSSTVGPAWLVDESGTDQDALALVEKHGIRRYDLIVLDMHLDTTGKAKLGTEIARELRQMGCASVIVLCTGSIAPTQSADLPFGVDLVWGKPLPEMSELVSDLADVLETHKNRKAYVR